MPADKPASVLISCHAIQPPKRSVLDCQEPVSGKLRVLGANSLNI